MNKPDLPSVLGCQIPKPKLPEHYGLYYWDLQATQTNCPCNPIMQGVWDIMQGTLEVHIDGIWDLLTHRLVRYPLVSHLHPKARPKYGLSKAYLDLILG